MKHNQSPKKVQQSQCAGLHRSYKKQLTIVCHQFIPIHPIYPRNTRSQTKHQRIDTGKNTCRQCKTTTNTYTTPGYTLHTFSLLFIQHFKTGSRKLHELESIKSNDFLCENSYDREN